MKKYIHYYILAMTLALFSPMVLLADGGDPVSDPGTGGSNGDPDAPIDGGLSLVLVAGAGYGIKKLKERKDTKLVDEESVHE